MPEHDNNCTEIEYPVSIPNALKEPEPVRIKSNELEAIDGTDIPEMDVRNHLSKQALDCRPMNNHILVALVNKTNLFTLRNTKINPEFAADTRMVGVCVVKTGIAVTELNCNDLVRPRIEPNGTSPFFHNGSIMFFPDNKYSAARRSEEIKDTLVPDFRKAEVRFITYHIVPEYAFDMIFPKTTVLTID